MIYVSKHQLAQVEYLIAQSVQGNHVLFDAEEVKQIFARPSLFTEQEAYEMEPLLEKLILEPSLDRKREFLQSLDPSTYEQVVRTYFNIVENNIYENLKVVH